MIFLHHIQSDALRDLRNYLAYPEEDFEGLVWVLPDWYYLLENTPAQPAKEQT